MEVIRTIHPIGLGAFYTERIIDDVHTFNIVFDCGAGLSNTPDDWLKKEISSYYTKNDVIDLLFISHFDKDHINGISELKKTKGIKNIVVPLVEEENYWFYYVENQEFEQFYNSLGLIADNVYKVKISNGEDYTVRYNDMPSIDLTDNSKGGDVENGQRLKFGNADWYYIPFNYNRKERINILLTELVKNGLSEDILKGHDWDKIKDNLVSIKDSYKKVLHDGSNKTSLIVYSGGVSGDFDCCQYTFSYSNCYYWIEQEGCLYFGDNDLNQTDLLKYLFNKLLRLTDRVGSIQIPHHGSLKNFNAKLLDINKDNRKMFFVSFGNNNKYGHPSLRVLEDIIRSHNYVFGVTENRNSAFFQVIQKR